MLLIPDLGRTPFDALNAHLLLTDLGAPGDSEQLRRAFADKEFKLRRCDSATFSQPYVLYLEFEVSGRDVTIDIGLHLDRITLLEFDLAKKFGKTKPSEPAMAVPEFQAFVAERLGVLSGLELNVEGTCGFEIDLNKLPPGGIICRGIGARAQFGDDTLRLSGAQFAINGEVEHTISWFVDPYLPDWESIEGSVFSRDMKLFSPSLLTDILETAQQRFDRYILESNVVAAK